MSSAQDQDLIAAAKRAELNLNSQQAKQGHAGSDSTTESGVDASVEREFPGASVTYGSAASGAGDNREIPPEQGGDIKRSGQPTKAGDFEGLGGPEDKLNADLRDKGGDESLQDNVRQKK